MSIKKITLIITILSVAFLFYFINIFFLHKKSIPSTKTIVLVGDSMTEYLGNFELLDTDLKKYYPGTTFELLNYGFSSTNILSIPDRLIKASNHKGRILQAINDIPFDLILIESMGNNPLSEYSTEEGVRKQNETLDNTINIISQKHPKSSIVFIATIAPNKNWYGYGVLSLSPQQKQQWVSERIVYIKNHMEYAKSHSIPLINIFYKSLDNEGNGNIDYLNSNDFIHPSPRGLMFISAQIADFISQNKLLK